MYLDDIVVFSKNDVMYMAHLRQVLTLLREAVVTLLLKKCSIFPKKIIQLKYAIRPRRLELLELATAAVRELKDATTQTSLRSISGFRNLFRRLLPRFSTVAVFLNRKLQEGQPTTFHPLLGPKRTRHKLSDTTDEPVNTRTPTHNRPVYG